MKPTTILSIVIIVTALGIVGITLSLSLIKVAHMLFTVKMSLNPSIMDVPLLDQGDYHPYFKCRHLAG